MSMLEVQPRRWTRQEYDRMVEAGIFGPEDRIELLDGEILEVTPQGTPHSVAIRLVEIALGPLAAGQFDVRGQMPIALDGLSEPEPDVAVVRGGPRDYLDDHPAAPVLVVEVSATSLEHDRGRKLRAYARNGVPEYWIVNLPDHCLEVYREPAGDAYGSVQRLRSADEVQPLFAPSMVSVADLLP